MVLGVVAVVAAFATTMLTMAFLGLLMLTGGAAQAVHAFRFWGNEWGSFVPALLVGILYAVAGGVVLASPGAAVLALALMMAVVMTAAGIVRLAWGIFSGGPGRGWPPPTASSRSRWACWSGAGGRRRAPG
jgi:uncharacterized membrane protein HdeD (DUF308 family)